MEISGLESSCAFLGQLRHRSQLPYSVAVVASTPKIHRPLGKKTVPVQMATTANSAMPSQRPHCCTRHTPTADAAKSAAISQNSPLLQLTAAYTENAAHPSRHSALPASSPGGFLNPAFTSRRLSLYRRRAIWKRLKRPRCARSATSGFHYMTNTGKLKP